MNRLEQHGTRLYFASGETLIRVGGGTHRIYIDTLGPIAIDSNNVREISPSEREKLTGNFDASLIIVVNEDESGPNRYQYSPLGGQLKLHNEMTSQEKAVIQEYLEATKI